jgi:hypothetical protein
MWYVTLSMRKNAAVWVESDDDSPDEDSSDDESPQSKKVSLYVLLLDSVQLLSIIITSFILIS